MRRSLISLRLPKDMLSTLTRHGYETVEDINSVGAEELSKSLKIPLEDLQNLFARIQKPSALMPTVPISQAASNLIQNMSKISTGCLPLDDVLEGGLSRGQILELSGPPGSPKERIALSVLKSFVEDEHEVLFIDCQNMTTPTVINHALVSVAENDQSVLNQRIHYQNLYKPLDFLMFVHRLPNLLSLYPKVSLLVINSISFPFQNPAITLSQRKHHLDKVKQTLHKASTLYNLTIVTTSQLSLKMLNPDGTPGTFDSGGKGVMLPSLGHAYLPTARTYRVLVAPDGMYSGTLKLLSSPVHMNGKVPPELQNVPYAMPAST